MRRAAFALRFGETEPLISNFITDESRILYIRDIEDRVETLAPFLHWDADPYPVILDGRIQYVLDGYTTTDRYPYAQRADTDQVADGSGLDHSFNYVRNSVKAVVDTYDGTVDLYIVDPDDPIIEAYSHAFPDLFTDCRRDARGLQEHLRYPEDLFRIQTNTWGRYHIDERPELLRAGRRAGRSPRTRATRPRRASRPRPPTPRARWCPPARPGSTPQYLLMRLPGEEQEDFLILRSFVPTAGDQRAQGADRVHGRQERPGQLRRRSRCSRCRAPTSTARPSSAPTS